MCWSGWWKPVKDVTAAMAAIGVVQVAAGEIEALCRQLLADNPQIVADVQAGKEKAVGALIGQARKLNSNANPNEVRETCLRIIREG